MKSPRFDAELEAAFDADLAIEKIRTTRYVCVLASLLFAAFAILDVWSIPSAVHWVWLIRFGGVIPMLAAVGLLTFTPAFLRHYRATMVVMFMGMGLAIEAMVFLAGPEDHARTAYYAGLILVVMGLYTWTYMRITETAIMGLLLVVIYIAIAAAAQKLISAQEWHILVSNCFFFVSANLVGIISVHIRNRFMRRSFLLKRSLHSEIAAKERALAETEYLAHHDMLTGLPNRQYLLQSLSRALISAGRGERRAAVLFIDLDGFKQINDSFGHAVGDSVLRVTAQRLLHCLRNSDIVGRVGGDEFVAVLLLGPERESQAVVRVAEKLLDGLGEPILVGGNMLRVTPSIGLALHPEHGADPESLLMAADQAMYEVKRLGKNGFRLAEAAASP